MKNLETILKQEPVYLHNWQTKMILANNPSIGFIATLIAFITPFISAVLPIVQLLVAIVGLIIGLLTVEAKWKERQLNKKKKTPKAKYEN